MALKAVLDTLDGVDEAHKALYVQADGKFRLDVEGGFKTSEEISGLTSALGKERSSREAAERAAKAFEGLDPEKAREALEKLKTVDLTKLKSVEEIQREWEAREKPLKDKLTQYEQSVLDLNNQLDSQMIGGAFGQSKFIKEKVAIPVRALTALYAKQFKREDGKVVAYDQNGNKIYGDDGQPAAFEVALEKLVMSDPDKDNILKGSGAGGSGARGGGGGGGNNGTDYSKLSPAERLNAARRAGAK